MNEEMLNDEIIVKERYYYKDSRGNYYSYKEEHNDLIEITEQEWNEHIASITPSVPTQEQLEKATKKRRIIELKQNLKNTDYQAIKYAEGQLTEEEYAPMKAQRQAWRDEINYLEQQSEGEL